MKKQKWFLAVIITIVIMACHEQNKDEGNKEWEASVATSALCSYELAGPAGKDTINCLDCDGRKQGHWIVTKYIVHKSPDTLRPHEKEEPIPTIVEEGFYKDDKKEGVWKYYNKEDGSLKDSVVYKNGEIVK